jgi:cobalt-zinc-cadmium efflux system membrane fusion protein
MNYLNHLIKLSLLGYLLIGCNGSDTKNDAAENMPPTVNDNLITVSKLQFENAGMILGGLTEQDFAETVQTSGMIDVPPQNRAVISAFAGGYIKNTPLLVGDKVKKGQILVTLENPEFITMQRQYLETAEQMKYLKSEYERQKTLVEENITSQKRFLRAESDYKVAKARYNSFKKNLMMLNINPTQVENGIITSQTSIYSPIDGNITQLDLRMGAFVSASDELMEIISIDHMHLELKVFEKDVMNLKKDQEILFRIPEASNKIYRAEVHLVGTSIDPKERIALVHGHIEEDNEQDTNFTVGMFVDAEIVINKLKKMALPEDAVIEKQNRMYVLKLEDEDAENYHFKQELITAISSYNGYQSIDSASKFQKEDRFLVKGAFAMIQDEGGESD